jgi:error-prone DNA polymerase
LFFCKSYFSLRYGTLSPETLAKEARARGIECLLLADINNTSAHFDYVRACAKEGIRALLGIEFRTEDKTPLYIGIAQNNQGIYELNSFFTKHSLEGLPFPSVAPAFEHCFVVYRLPWGVPESLRENEFVGIASYETNKLYSSPWRKRMNKLVAYQNVCFLDAAGYETHELLSAIDQNTLLSKLDKRFISHETETFLDEERVDKVFEAYPELLANAGNLFDACEIALDTESPKNRKHFTRSAKDDAKLLEKLTYEGMQYRYGSDNKEAQARIKKELKVISDLGFLSYFLITYDIVRYAQSKGYYHVGRGSGANSIVAYCLKITDVDPIELDLYFERFINPHRTSPPDFDIDFSWDERDDVIDYVFKRYGGEHVALMATYSTFKGASIIRELGKVFGLPKSEIDTIADAPLETLKHHPLASVIFEKGKALIELPNHLGIHAGGMLITEEPLCNHTALLMMPKGFPIVHFDMHVAEENGFFKFDILSQRGIGHIKETVAHIRRNKQVSVDVHRVEDFKRDPNIRERLKAAKTIGCFYIESPAMRGLLSKLRCDNYISLVAASSIIRPGVAKSGMMREYISRFHNPTSFKYLHPKFAEFLGETYGVMVYQEDVIKVAHYFAGLDLGEADILRRAMSGKSRGKKEFERIQLKFFENCKAYGYPDALALEVWRQIESFSGYSFCKAHSASFAVESYQSLFLKTYYPMEFMVGVINNFGGFYNTELYVHEARMSGATIEAPCVNESDYLTTIKGTVIYLGFVHLKSLEEKLARNIVKERERNGRYVSLEDFIKRTLVNKEQLCILIRIGALRFTGKSKQELLWEKSGHLKLKKEELANAMLFAEGEQSYVLPPLEVEEMEAVHDQIELLGFPLASPFDLLKTSFRGDIMTKDLSQHIGKMVRMVGYFVARKHVRTSNGNLMNFGTWVDYEGQFFDTTHFPKSIAQYPFRGSGCYLLLGQVVEDFGFPSLEVEKMGKLPVRSS